MKYFRVVTKSNIDEISIGLVTEEYREYTIADNKLIGQKQILSEGRTLAELWTDDGKKYFEEYIDSPYGLAYQTIWNKKNNIISHLISNGDEKIKTVYFDNESSSIKELIKLTPYKYQFDSICVYDKTANIFWAEQPIPRTSKPIKIYKNEFYDNGKKKSEIAFIQKTFLGFVSKKEYKNYLKTNDVLKIIDEISKIRYGTWLYFDKEGNILEETIYDINKNPKKVIKDY